MRVNLNHGRLPMWCLQVRTRGGRSTEAAGLGPAAGAPCSNQHGFETVPEEIGLILGCSVVTVGQL